MKRRRSLSRRLTAFLISRSIRIENEQYAARPTGRVFWVILGFVRIQIDADDGEALTGILVRAWSFAAGAGAGQYQQRRAKEIARG